MYKRDEVKIMNRIKSDYDYLESLGFEVVAVALQGSQNYDLDYEDSDIDTRAIVLPKFTDLIMGNKKVSKTIVLESDEHIDVKDIRLMFDNFLKQNINFLEFLFTDYIYINPLYADSMQTIFDNREEIAHYDNYRLINCMIGMMHQKHKALEHPCPATKAKIEKYGYDGKQLHHTLRYYEFMKRYMLGETFADCLKTKDADYLLKVKKNEAHELEKARHLSLKAVQRANAVKKHYAKKNKNVINDAIPKLLDAVTLEILSNFCKKHLKEEQNER
jgi:predicted nucleotidyltransferase